jgi:anti-sigma factor RsiW
MDCKQFREKHYAYIDDTLPGIELVRAQRHIAECEQCASHDWMVRRSLLLFKNLPSIEPSADFDLRLQSKIRESIAAQDANHRSFKLAGAAAAIFGAAMLGYIATALPNTEAPRDILMPPVVASIPDIDVPAASAAGPAIVASLSAGLPIWTAALYAEQAPQHFAKPELTLASYSR